MSGTNRALTLAHLHAPSLTGTCGLASYEGCAEEAADSSSSSSNGSSNTSSKQATPNPRGRRTIVRHLTTGPGPLCRDVGGCFDAASLPSHSWPAAESGWSCSQVPALL